MVGRVFLLAALPLASILPSPEEVPGRYIVVLKPGVRADAIVKRHGLAVDQEFAKVIRGFSATGSVGKLAALQQDPQVERAEPDRYVTAFAQVIPSGINRIDADVSATAAINGGGANIGVDIAILDTGIYKHPDLNVAGGYNCTTRKTSNWSDGNGHGTHVAGTAAAKDNTTGVVGVAPGARLWAVKVLDNSGSGFLSWIICGVDYVTRNASTIEVANMSLGGAFTSATLDTAIANSVAKGVVYAVAAGNSAADAADFSPANHSDVLTVSAIADSDGKCGALGPSTNYGNDDTLASFSNFGSLVDLAAPGVNIRSTYKSGKYATLRGTSMASPHVAGAAALFMSGRGRDMNSDGVVNGADVAVVRESLLSRAASQSQTCDHDGFGGFTGDSDGASEPLLYAAGL